MFGFIESVAASLTASLIASGLFKGNSKQFQKKLKGIIDKIIVEYSRTYPIVYKDNEIPFYGSQAIINELLQFSFFEELDQDKISEALKENPNIIRPSIDELNNFLGLFNSMIKDCKELKGAEKKEKFIDKNYENYLKLDEILKLLKYPNGEKEKVIPKYLPKQPPFYNPNNLIGRDGSIKRISDELKSKSNVTLVNGIGGIGKTTIAQAYVNMDELMEIYDHVAWITVFDNIMSDMISQLAGCLPAFIYRKEATPEENFYNLLNILGEIDGNNLLVIDNANNLQNLLNVKKGIDNLRWKVIITSRTETQGYNKIYVDKLEKKDAKTLFYRYYKKEKNDKLLEKLLIKIEYHTLLTELLAKAANENPALNLEKICKILDSKNLAAEELQTNIITDHQLDKNNKAKMVKLYEYINSIFEATAANLYEQEKKYLLWFAVMPSQFYDFETLTDYFQIEKNKKTGFADTLNLLYRKGWLIKENDAYKAHALIQIVARGRLIPDAKKCGVLIDTFKWKLFTEPGDNPLSKKEFVPFAENLCEAIKDEDINMATLSNNLADKFIDLGNYEKALEYNLKSLTIKKKVLEENHPSLATTYNNIAIAFLYLAKYEKTLEYNQKAMIIREKVLEPNHPSLAASYNNMALTYIELGNYEKALEYNLKDISIIEKVLEPNHPDLAIAYNNIAVTYSNLGNYEKALEYRFKALEIEEEVLETNHPQLASSYNNTAYIFNILGNYEKALEYNLKDMEISESVFEPNHPNLANTYNNIADTLYNLGNYEKAMEYNQKAISILEKVLETDHPELAAAYDNIARGYRHLGNYEKALEYNKKAISILEKVLETNHPNLAPAYSNIAHTYNDLGNYEKALEYNLKDIEISIKGLEPEHPNLATSYNNIANTYNNLSNYEKALEHNQKNITIYEKVFESNHPNLAVSYLNIAATNYNLKKYQNAKGFIDKAVKILKKVFPKYHPDIKNALEWQEDINKELE